MANNFISLEEYQSARQLLSHAGEEYGSSAVERLNRALAIAAGLAPAVIAHPPDQMPEFIFPGLAARPWHEASTFTFSSTVEASAPLIRRELENVIGVSDGFQPYRQDSCVPRGHWDALYLRVGNIWLEENRKLFPETFRVLESVPRLAEIGIISALSGGGHIAPHSGAWNCIITLHLGLIIPDNCALRVGNETRTWKSDKLLAFDDTFEHEAWNNSPLTRYVLLFNVWHPDLSDIEVELLEQLREHAGIRHGEYTVAQIRTDRVRFEESCATSASISRPAVLKSFSSSLMDWSRLAEPQADQYDSNVILQLAASTVAAGRPEPYERTPVGDSPAVFDEQVAIRYAYRSLPEFGTVFAQYYDAPLDHPNIALATEYIRNWPVAFTQCQRLLEAIHPALDPRMPLETSEVYRGSSCHSFERLFGTMWATIFCPIGLAEAIVHEMAHQKLRILGVSFESAKSIVANSPSNFYVSPITKDCMLPMTAVLHAEYSYVHVTTLDVHILKAERDATRRAALKCVLERNLARIEEGYETLRTHFQPGEHGQEFIDGFWGWTQRTILTATDALRR